MAFSAKRAVVPVDFSDQSFEALDTASGIVAQTSDLHVIHVLPELSPAAPGVIWGHIDDGARMKHAGDALRKRLGDRYRDATVEIAIGNAAREVARYAESIEADLIVLPSHGRSGIARALIGSVAENVVRRAHCPVLVLRGPS